MVWPPPPTGRRLHAEFATEADAKAAANGTATTQATQRRQQDAAKRDDKGGRREERQEQQPASKKESAPPKKKAKTLDDLFRSTKTEPRIYWLPAVPDDAPESNAPEVAERTAAEIEKAD